MLDDAGLIRALSEAEYLPEAALTAALARPEAVADETLRLLTVAADGADLEDSEANLLFWGLHVLAHARDHRALGPLLRLLRQDEETLDALLGDAVTTTLAKVVASLFTGETDALFATILDSTVDGGARASLFSACTFLAFEGRIERDALRSLLIRFDDAKAAIEGDLAWIGWEETIAHLGFRDLAGRAAAARQDRRITNEISDAEWFRDTLRDAERRPDDRRRLDPRFHGTLDDPVAELAWTREGAGLPQRNLFKDVGRNDPCPCGSGKKFKKCCLGKSEAEMAEVIDRLKAAASR